jgi:hypothetical protein
LISTLPDKNVGIIGVGGLTNYSESDIKKYAILS